MSDAPFVARVSRARVAANVLMVLAMIAVVAVTLVMADRGNWFLRLAFAGILLMFLYGALQIGRCFFHRGEILSVDADGIRMPACYQGTLRWSAIARAAVVKGRLNFWLAEDAAIPSGKQLEHILRSTRAIRRDGDGPDLAVTLWLADRRTDELVAAVRAQAPQLFA